jgi:hypothetical protein
LRNICNKAAARQPRRGEPPMDAMEHQLALEAAR